MPVGAVDVAGSLPRATLSVCEGYVDDLSHSTLGDITSLSFIEHLSEWMRFLLLACRFFPSILRDCQLNCELLRLHAPELHRRGGIAS
jgi:hypothetical protein